MTAITQMKSERVASPRNPTDVDRELELIARKLLEDTATDKDRAEYQRLLSWRRNHLFNLPSVASVRRFKDI